MSEALYLPADAQFAHRRTPGGRVAIEVHSPRQDGALIAVIHLPERAARPLIAEIEKAHHLRKDAPS